MWQGGPASSAVSQRQDITVTYSKVPVVPIFDCGTTDSTDNNRDILHLELFKKLNVPVVVMTNASFQS
jgi:predicted metal-dependent TIM-barrel fold hydrolase